VKLSTLKPPEAMHVGLLIGLDTTVREQFYLQRDIEGRFAEEAKLGNWSHITRQFAPREVNFVHAL